MNSIESSWQSAGWYHAATLKERLQSLQGSHNPLTIEPGNRREAEEAFQQWKQQAPFHISSLFADRLALDAITEQDLLALLVEPIERVRDRLIQSGPPHWLEELARAFTGADAPTATDLRFPEQEGGEDFAFLRPLLPLLQRGIQRLQEGIDRLSQRYDMLPFDPQNVASLFLPNLAQQLQPQLHRTFVLELNIARLRGQLEGETSEERFQSYIQFLSNKDVIASLLEEYSVLARQLVITLDFWVTFSLEFLQHLSADWPEICTHLAPVEDPGLLATIDGGAGDTHRGGRSVMLLQFASGWQLVYKPKSLAIDVHFQELLTWLNEHGDHPGFKTTRLLNKGSYGWSEFIPARECTSEKEVERFYERQGGYLALLYILQAVDFHAENIIAAGEHPMLVDLEALLHPQQRREEASLLTHPALLHSVLHTDLLPQRAWSEEDAIGVDLSGLGGQEGQLFPRPARRWEGEQTDEMHIVLEDMKTPGDQNRPQLNGQPVQTSDYCGALIKGFSTIYHEISTRRAEFLTHLLPRFSHDEIRFIARGTSDYALLLTESFHPNKLRDALKRERFFDYLWLAVKDIPYLSRLIAAERADLLNGDIPLFTTYPDSHDLITSQGEVIQGVFEETSLERARMCIEQLGEEDLARQCWIIKASFACMSLDIHNPPSAGVHLRPVCSDVNHTQCVQAARAIGEQLNRQALRKGGAAGWLDIGLYRDREWSLQVSDISLYNGVAGIALFLSYLGSLTGDVRFTELARAAVAKLRADMQKARTRPEQARVGVFDGWGSVVYLLSHLGMLWHDHSLFKEAEELVALLPDLVEKDESLDIMAGSAGCIASLLSLYAVWPSAKTLTVALQCGDHLLARAQPDKRGQRWLSRSQEPLPPGFLSGTTGIVWSLLKLARASGEERFRYVAMQTLQHEQSALSVTGEQQDARPCERGVGRQSWCQGAPGIGLARLDCLEELPDEQNRREIDRTLNVTLAAGFGWNHALCHGDFGNLELLLVAARTLRDHWSCGQTRRIVASLLDSLTTQRWVTGVPTGIETPGLMTGLAGTGYQLLRLAAPEQIPSVLLLQPPVIRKEH
ncbi:type 2 lanthipeptide synthetase LanM family protein [Dictyobacter aurantiacus]|uniref:type 2 lanthipeptide synthetase LanM family protein n=1 Tax=Dictyobacter aurantiacus TaxID=1936993 RepID=UPI0013577A54|nr:type 2 lanthipeptide synthetase LanM family protein [Dictyobacter aurantiacus]